MGYLLNTELQQIEMLKVLELSSVKDVHKDLPSSLLLEDGPNIPYSMSEQEILESFEKFAAKNTVFPSIFRGAGAYKHFIPSIVPEMVNKERFKTGYTPYQAEVSQGTLQSTYEFQTMICELTGMDISNASMYDGASAAAEAVAMCKERRRKTALVSASVNPRTLEVIQTYSWAADSPVEVVPTKNGVIDIQALEKMITEETASITIQQPNYFGLLEDAEKIIEIAHKNDVKVVMSVNPLALSVLQTPGEIDADIAVGEGQPLGIPMSFGGPYLGFLAAKGDLARKIPGRIAGETTDSQGRRAYVLTLQAREQHIRRETASSNICSNQALMTIAASVYMSAMGPEGVKDAAMLSYNKAHYLAEELSKVKGFNLRYDSNFFHEFVTECPVEPMKLLKHLENNGILGGMPLKDGGILWCATEMNKKEHIDRLVALCKEVAE